MSRAETSNLGIERILAAIREKTTQRSELNEEPLSNAPTAIPPLPELPTTPTEELSSGWSAPTSQHTSAELGEWIDHGVKVEIDRREQERLARQGRVAGAD